MSKELIEQLAKEHLKRGEVIADNEGYGDFVVTPNGEFVRYEDVSKMLKAYAQTQGQSIPDGWKLVPIKPTAEMIEAAFSAYDVLDSEEGMVRQNLRNDYKTMLKAAPIESGVKG